MKKPKIKVSKKNPIQQQEFPLSRYLIAGAGFGLYFGWFFTPLREVNYLFAFGLAIYMTLFMALVRYIPKSRPALQTIPVYLVLTYITVAFFMVMLELRHPAYDDAGRMGAIVTTTILGAIGGGVYYMRRKILG